MNTDNADRPVQSGDTFIAYIDDSASCVGVVIGDGNDEMDFKTLVLGHFKEIHDSTKRDVFEEPFPYTFPGYLELPKRYVVPYDFELEIALCKARNSEWWKSLQAPCYPNLVARHFRPSKLEELQYIDMARQILQGKYIDDFRSFAYWDEETFLKMWSVLYLHFPEKVKRPPRERDSKFSNVYYLIDLECDPPNITSRLRPTTYNVDKECLSHY